MCPPHEQGVFTAEPTAVRLRGVSCDFWDWGPTHIRGYCDSYWGGEASGNYLEVEFGSTGTSGWWDLVRGTYTMGLSRPAALHITGVACGGSADCLDVGTGEGEVTVTIEVREREREVVERWQRVAT